VKKEKKYPKPANTKVVAMASAKQKKTPKQRPVKRKEEAPLLTPFLSSLVSCFRFFRFLILPLARRDASAAISRWHFWRIDPYELRPTRYDSQYRASHSRGSRQARPAARCLSRVMMEISVFFFPHGVDAKQTTARARISFLVQFCTSPQHGCVRCRVGPSARNKKKSARSPSFSFFCFSSPKSVVAAVFVCSLVTR
jgi:hypothetical protein